MVPTLGLVVMLVVAFAHGWRSDKEARWPYLFDCYRDIGIAQGILDGSYPQDYMYRDATLWYNPATGALVALGAWLSGAPVYIVDTRLGIAVNLLVPALFFFFVARYLDRWSALASTAMLLFGNCWQDVGATYAPWLWAPQLALAPFCLALFLYWWAWRSRRVGWYIATGLAHGVTFMTHTAPAVFFGIVVLVTSLERIYARLRREPNAPSVHAILLNTGVLLAVAFVSSLPYTYSILWNYQFHMVNLDPAHFVSQALLLENWRGFVTDRLSVSNLMALIGLVFLVVRSPGRFEGCVLLCLLASALLCLADNYVAQIVFRKWGVHYPRFVLGHHSLIALSTLKAVLFGYGTTCLAHAALRGIGRLTRSTRGATSERPAQWEWRAGALVAVAITCIALGPRYAESPSFTTSMWWLEEPWQEYEAAYFWVLDHTDPSDVFLCHEGLPLKIAGAAGRKVVAAYTLFSNPYIEYLSRDLDNEAMFEALHRKDHATFRSLAAKYDVKYVLTRTEDTEAIDAAGFPDLVQRFRRGSCAVFELTGA
ncbi:MAG TPA: hypothetical protein ENN80_14400 [Candidatus Hydrogenedentes bacterium]|nr:hypothetical protein [Candidatus Hydrogenedentota bacterium]